MLDGPALRILSHIVLIFAFTAYLSSLYDIDFVLFSKIAIFDFVNQYFLSRVNISDLDVILLLEVPADPLKPVPLVDEGHAIVLTRQRLTRGGAINFISVSINRATTYRAFLTICVRAHQSSCILRK